MINLKTPPAPIEIPPAYQQFEEPRGRTAAPLSKRQLVARLLENSGVGPLCRYAKSWSGVLILNYHRIGDCRHSLLDRNLWSATAADFEAQMRLVARNFEVIGVDDLNRALHETGRQRVLITFDDGYSDNYSIAYPILRRLGLPAVFFLTTGFFDDHVVPWWDEIAWMARTARVAVIPANRWFSREVLLDVPSREHTIRRLLSVYKTLDGSETEDYLEFLSDFLNTGRAPYLIARDLWMTWDQVREMRAGGMAFGAHTHSHPVLSSLTDEQQDEEVRRSGARLAEELGEPTRLFSYPVGGPTSFNQATRDSLDRHGYEWAFSYYGGYCRPGRYDRFALARTAIETDIDIDVFSAITTLPQFFA